MSGARHMTLFLLMIAFAGLGGGGVSWFASGPELAVLFWQAGTVPILLALLIEIARSLGRGEVGLDIVAALSMSAALALGEPLAASVVSLMFAGGGFLEDIARHRAERDMRLLLELQPRHAMLHENGGLREVPIEQIRPGDRLLVRQGEITPVDGTAGPTGATLDLSVLTGESLPVTFEANASIPSGGTNLGHAFDLIATSDAADSTYAGIVRLVEAAQKARAPMVRLADRYSLGFLAVTLALATGAWLVTGDPVRLVAVLVVATPCPLILGVPIALVAGMSRAARHGVLIKGSGALEMLANARTLILDKTGTLTDGRPAVISIIGHTLPESEVLRLAASLDQASRHPVAQALVSAARDQGLPLPPPDDVHEIAGEGVIGTVDGRHCIVGGIGFVSAELGLAPADMTENQAGEMTVTLAIDGRIAGQIVCADVLREGTRPFLGAARQLGIRRLLLATGDRRDVADKITEGLDFDLVAAGLSPEGKVDLVLAERTAGPVMMVGDGVNDAPALAAADIGVAMGARGAAASADTADVVLMVDRLDQILPGITIARAAKAIALQSVFAGLGLSVAGMIAAALGYLTPVEGAVLQEAIDVAVILNALRALAIDPDRNGTQVG